VSVTGFMTLEWACQTNLRYAFVSRICMLNFNLLSFIVPEISTFIRTDGHGQIDSAIDPDQKYIYFVWSKRFLLLVTYFSKSITYPFTLRATGIKKNEFIIIINSSYILYVQKLKYFKLISTYHLFPRYI